MVRFVLLRLSRYVSKLIHAINFTNFQGPLIDPTTVIMEDIGKISTALPHENGRVEESRVARHV